MPTTGTHKVLVVAPDSAAAALRRLLEDRGYQVISAGNGALGLLAAHAEMPGMVIVDAEMPVLNGYQMLEALRSDANTRPITAILLLPRGTDSEMTRGWMSGADSCLPRDGSTNDLLLMVDRAMVANRPAEYSLAS